jgi:hypothetical protein
VVWDPEHQLPYLTEDEAIQLAIDQSDLDQLAERNGIGFQLRESALAQGTAVTLPVTSERQMRSPSATAPVVWDPWPEPPPAATLPPPRLALPVYHQLPPVPRRPLEMMEVIDLTGDN